MLEVLRDAGEIESWEARVLLRDGELPIRYHVLSRLP